MSRGDRWYVFAADEAGVFDIAGWSRTTEAARARVEKIDPGPWADGQLPRAFKVFAKDRPQARQYAAEMFGVKVRGYISADDKRVGRAIVKGAVMRAIFCPYTGQVLDMRRAVVIVTPTSSHVCSAEHWDKRVAAAGGLDVIRANAPRSDIYDGRELFRR